MANEQNLKPFVKNDPRINTKGRPKNFKQLRALVVQIAAEPIKEGETITRIEKMLRDMVKSDNPSDRALILKYAYGNVPDEVDVTSKGEKIQTTNPEEIAAKVAALLRLAEARKDASDG